jgi:Kef-type K+ transport system membrane component KefB
MDLPVVFLTLGALFLAGLAADMVGRRSRVPRVTLLLACGIAAGGSGFDLIPAEAEAWYEFLSVTALTMVAFLLGGALTLENLVAHGRAILAISIAIVLVTLAVVSAGIWALGAEPAVALILGAIATATAPAATQDALRQTGHSGSFTDTLLGIVAIDDAWGLIVFSLVIVVAGSLGGGADAGILVEAGREIGGAILVGALVGFPGAVLTGRLSGGDPLRTEALGLVFLTAGLSLWLEVSFLLAGMTAGTIIVNRARHHTRAFHEIEHIEWPFMILFFILAGAALDPDHLADLGSIGAAYVVLRIVARLLGGAIGARIGRAPEIERRWYGIALLPQAGVAVGMALVAAEEFPELADTVLTLTIGATVLFEIIGPAATIWAVGRVSRAEEAAAGTGG